jgi:hypothetical protein
VPEADLSVIHEFDAGLLTRDARDLGADLALQHAVDVSVIDIDESGRAAGGRDFRRDDFLGVRTAGGDLDRAESVLLDILGVAAELAGREMLRLDTAAASFVEDLRPVSKALVKGEPMASEWPMRQTNFCCAPAIGAPKRPMATVVAAPLMRSRRRSRDLLVSIRFMSVLPDRARAGALLRSPSGDPFHCRRYRLRCHRRSNSRSVLSLAMAAGRRLGCESDGPPGAARSMEKSTTRKEPSYGGDMGNRPNS